MVVIDMSTFEKPSKEVLLTIRQGDNWKCEGKMTEEQALKLAAECRKRGLGAEVSNG